MADWSSLAMDRRLSAILAADVVGYSRLMATDEAGTLARLKADRKALIEPKATQYHGRIIKLMGDGILFDFASVVDAVAFAIEVQCAVKAREASGADEGQILYRIGINVGDVIVEDGDIYGDGVNIAARLEGLAEPGGICISGPVHTQVKGKLDLTFELLGEKEIKNIADPVTIYRIALDDKAAALVTPVIRERPKRTRRWAVIAAGLAASIASIGGAVWWSPWVPGENPASIESALPLPDKPSIAVLPFDNLSDDPNQDYFADGMADDLTTDLSKISGLFVIARNSSFSYKGQKVTVRQMARELGVRYILEGSVRRTGRQVRINVQLIDAATSGHLWAERFDGSLDDVFKFQDMVRANVVEALAVNLTGEEKASQPRLGTGSINAHDAYLQGMAHYRLSTPQDLAKAVPFFEEAVRLDPDYVQAHAALASLYWDVYVNDWAFDLGMPSFGAAERANEHLKAALQSPSPLAHVVQSRMYAASGHLDDAVVEAQKAVALDDNDPTTLTGLANALVLAGRPSEALSFIEQAMRLDPQYPPNYLTILGAAQFGLERFEEAAATFERAVKRNPDVETPLIYLASAYGHLGRIDDADGVIETANALRARSGLGDLSLEKKEAVFSFSPFQGEIDFESFGTKPAQERVRAGLIDVPALTWQYLVTVHKAGENTWREVEGATKIDLATAKSLYDEGAVFIDVNHPDEWAREHIRGSVNLYFARFRETGRTPFTKERLLAVADKEREIILYCQQRGRECEPFIAAAKAVRWGYLKVHYIAGGLPAWKAARYPVEPGR
jgi:adenylate cyclase